jgi:UDP-GlcNAc:undecaprenyl-phosphate GlcNAc-1-phosphate transferase
VVPVLSYYNPGVSTTHLTVLIPLFILAIPLFDTLAVVVIRLRNGKPVYVGDHNHISHRFLHMGMTRKQAVLLVHLSALVSGLGVLPLLWGDEKTCFVLLIQGATFLLLISILQCVAGGRQEVKGEPPASDASAEDAEPLEKKGG